MIQTRSSCRSLAKLGASLCTAVLLLAVPAAPVLADDAPRTISVSGSGEVTAGPDTALVTAGVLTEAGDARTALAENNKAVAAVFGELKKIGIAERDMQTRNFNVSPRYDRPERGEPNRIVGYQVSNQVAVRVRDLDKLGPLLDRLIGAGANQMNGIQFYVDRSDALMDEARRKAVADAKRKAEILASEAGTKIKRVISISENGMRSPQPVMFRAMAADKAESVPVASGEQTISATVSVTYEIE